MSNFKIKEGRYYSTNDFVGSNDLEKLADQLFGEGWEPADDVDQMQELCDSVKKNKYRVKYIEGLRSDCDLEVEDIEPLMNVNQAKKFLEDKGWQTYELWHIDNVKELYECSDDEAMELLIDTIYSVREDIADAMIILAKDHGLKRKEVCDE